MLIDFRARVREERERERNINGLPLIRAPTSDWTGNGGMFPHCEWNLWPLGPWDDAPANWATLAGAESYIF